MELSVDEVIVYKTIETPKVLTKQYDGILFFSPSAVKSFFSKNSIVNNQNYLQLALQLQMNIKLIYTTTCYHC